MDAPRLCLQQKVKPPGFDRRLPEFQLTLYFQAKEFLICIFCASGAAEKHEEGGEGLDAAAPPPSGHTRDCSISSTGHILAEVPIPQGFLLEMGRRSMGREADSLRL